jgi:hypothetical protein
MKSSRKWLMLFAVIIGVLVIATTSLVLFTRGNNVALLPPDSPQGTVQRYLVAIQDKDYQTAFNYLSPDASPGKPITFNEWLLQVGSSASSSQSVWKASLGKITENSSSAVVEVIIDHFYSGSLFGNSSNNMPVTFELTKTTGGWLIISPTDIYWIY